MLSINEQAGATGQCSACEQSACDTERMDLASLIKSERERRGWSQRVLAKALGVSHGLVAQWENGDLKPPVARIMDLCNVFGLSAQSFLEGDGPYAGQIVTDPDEIALVLMWRRIPIGSRDLAMRMLSSAIALPSVPDVNVTKAPRKRHDPG